MLHAVVIAGLLAFQEVEVFEAGDAADHWWVPPVLRDRITTTEDENDTLSVKRFESRSGDFLHNMCQFIKAPRIGRTYFIGSEFDSIQSQEPFSTEFKTTEDLVRITELRFADYDCHFSQGATIVLARKSAEEAVEFVDIADIENDVSSRSVELLLSISRTEFDSISRDFLAAASDPSRRRIKRLLGTSISRFTGPANACGSLVAAVKGGRAVALDASSETRKFRFEVPSIDVRRLVLQFGELHGTPLGDFVDWCRTEGVQLELHPPTLRSERVRIVGRVMIASARLGELAEDIARGLGLRVTQDNDALHLWSVNELQASGREHCLEVSSGDIDRFAQREVSIETRIPLSRVHHDTAAHVLAGFANRLDREGKSPDEVITLRGPGRIVAHDDAVLRAITTKFGGLRAITNQSGALAFLRYATPPQPIFVSSEFDKIAFDRPQRIEITAANEMFSRLNEVLGHRGPAPPNEPSIRTDGYLVRQTQTLRARCAADANVSRVHDSVFVSPKEIVAAIAARSARPAVLLLTPCMGSAEEFAQRILVSMGQSSDTLIQRIPKTPLVAVYGPARDLAPVAAYFDRDEAFAAQPPDSGAFHPLGPPRSNDKGDHLVIQFDELEGTPLADFVKFCELQGWAIVTPPSTLADRSIRMFGTSKVVANDFRAFVSDVVRALDLVVVETETGQFWLDREAIVAGEAKEAITFQRMTPYQLRSEPLDSTLVEVELPLGRLPVTAAKSLLQPLAGEPRLEGAQLTPQGSLRIYGPRYLVARNVELLLAAEQLLGAK